MLTAFPLAVIASSNPCHKDIPRTQLCCESNPQCVCGFTVFSHFIIYKCIWFQAWIWEIWHPIVISEASWLLSKISVLIVEYFSLSFPSNYPRRPANDKSTPTRWLVMLKQNCSPIYPSKTLRPFHGSENWKLEDKEKYGTDKNNDQNVKDVMQAL